MLQLPEWLYGVWVLSAVLPLYPLYQAFMKAFDLFALTKEILFHRSGKEKFVPSHVRCATWRW